MTHPNPAEAMREACAKACSGRAEKHRTTGTDDIGEAWETDFRCAEAEDCAAAIRALPLPAPRAEAGDDDEKRRVLSLGSIDEDGCCVGCGREVPPSPCCPDYPVWPGPCRSCYSAPAPAEAGDAQREAERAVVEAAVRDLHALEERCAATCGRDYLPRGRHSPDCALPDLYLVDAVAALRRGGEGGDRAP